MDKALSKDFEKARNDEYVSHYSRIVASCIDNFDAITGVRESSFNTALGAALESNTEQTVVAMQISDEEFQNLEKKLKELRLDTSNALAIKKDVEKILSDALGADIITSEKVEKLISTVENKFAAFIEVKDRMAKRNLTEQAIMFEGHKDKNDALVKETIEKGAKELTVFKASAASKLSQAFSRVHNGFRSTFPEGKDNSETVVQTIGLLSAAVGVMLTNRKTK